MENRQGSKAPAIVLVVVGVLVLALSLAADVIGIGEVPGYMGWKQLVGAAIGLVGVLVGLVLALRRMSRR